MPRAYTPHEVLRVLEHLGWRVVRQRGDHVTLTKEGQPGLVTVPVARRDLHEEELHRILRQAGLRKREFEQKASEVI